MKIKKISLKLNVIGGIIIYNKKLNSIITSNININQNKKNTMHKK